MGQSRRHVNHTGAARNVNGAVKNLSIVVPLTGVERESVGAGTRFRHPFGRDGPLRWRDKEIDVAHPKSDVFRNAQSELDRPSQ
jgi:hypothetical protein